MWKLYQTYVEEMHMRQPFDPVSEMVEAGSLPVPAAPNAPPNVMTMELGPYQYAYIESVERTDVFQIEFEATATRDMLGNLNTNLLRTAIGWREEMPVKEAAATEN